MVFDEFKEVLRFMLIQSSLSFQHVNNILGVHVIQRLLLDAVLVGGASSSSFAILVRMALVQAVGLLGMVQSHAAAVILVLGNLVALAANMWKSLDEGADRRK